MYALQPPRPLPAAASVAIVALMAALLMLGLRVGQAVQQAPQLLTADFSAPQPRPTERPKPPEQRHARKPAPRDAASPRNLRNQATPIVAPPVRPLIVPPPVVTAPQAGIGLAANAGAANVSGPGQGAGGIGNGQGGGGPGGAGDGDGDPVVGPRQISGALHYSDLPAGVLAPGQQATVEVLYTVNPDGRASNCRAERGSGFAALDQLACRLIEQRFHFRPAKDDDGRPVRSQVIENHTWIAREN